MKTVSAVVRVFLLGRFEIAREEFLLRASDRQRVVRIETASQVFARAEGI
jgi:hypothetical protein